MRSQTDLLSSQASTVQHATAATMRCRNPLTADATYRDQRAHDDDVDCARRDSIEFTPHDSRSDTGSEVSEYSCARVEKGHSSSKLKSERERIPE